MKKNRLKTLYILIVFIGVANALGYLFNVIDAMIAFPIMFGAISIQNIYIGLKDKPHKKVYTLFGIAMLIYTTIYIIPYYYFNWWH